MTSMPRFSEKQKKKSALHCTQFKKSEIATTTHERTSSLSQAYSPISSVHQSSGSRACEISSLPISPPLPPPLPPLPPLPPQLVQPTPSVPSLDAHTPIQPELGKGTNTNKRCTQLTARNVGALADLTYNPSTQFEVEEEEEENSVDFTERDKEDESNRLQNSEKEKQQDLECMQSAFSIKRKKKSRKYQPNYSPEGVKRLLSITRQVLPMDTNHWAQVANMYENERGDTDVYRDLDSLRNKFDRLAGRKKQTGDSDWPQDVREAKAIKREIMARSKAAAVGDSSESGSEDLTASLNQPLIPSVSDSGNSTYMDRLTRKRRHFASLRQRKIRRTPGARGVKRRAPEEDEITKFIGEMAGCIEKLTQHLTSDMKGPTPDSNEICILIAQAVKAELHEQMKDINSSIKEIKDIVIGMLQSKTASP